MSPDGLFKSKTSEEFDFVSVMCNLSPQYVAYLGDHLRSVLHTAEILSVVCTEIISIVCMLHTTEMIYAVWYDAIAQCTPSTRRSLCDQILYLGEIETNSKIL